MGMGALGFQELGFGGLSVVNIKHLKDWAILDVHRTHSHYVGV